MADYTPRPDPEMTYPIHERPLPPRDVRQVGDYDTPMDYVVEYLPKYVYGGITYVGPLEYAPSLPQDLEPVEWVPVPTTPGRVI